MIELTLAGSNEPALIDDAFAHLVGFRWRLDRNGYVMRKAGGRRIYLHHVVLPGDHWPAYHRDHISRDKLDNRLLNLRWVNAAESQQNKSSYRCNKIGLRGVRFDEGRQQFLARVQIGGKAVVRRWFDDATTAAAFLADQRRQLMPFSTEVA